MEIMWSPWRSKYIGGFKNKSPDEKSECFICDAVSDTENDSERLVVARFDRCIVMMNRYPYNNGHMLIAPLRHTGDFTDLTPEELTEIAEVTQKCVSALENVYRPHGFNIGYNIGEAAGAGLPGHIHCHVLPRWNGDTSFVSTVGDMKVISFSMQEIYDSLRKEFQGE